MFFISFLFLAENEYQKENIELKKGFICLLKILENT